MLTENVDGLNVEMRKVLGDNLITTGGRNVDAETTNIGTTDLSVVSAMVDEILVFHVITVATTDDFYFCIFFKTVIVFEFQQLKYFLFIKRFLVYFSVQNTQ